MQLEAENWRLRSTTLVHGVFGELDEENWRLCSRRTGDCVVTCGAVEIVNSKSSVTKFIPTRGGVTRVM